VAVCIDALDDKPWVNRAIRDDFKRIEVKKRAQLNQTEQQLFDHYFNGTDSQHKNEILADTLASLCPAGSSYN
jgi:hypothetical protein